MKTAVERVKKLSKDEKLRIIEEKREKGRWIYESQMAYARDEGIEQGIDKGVEKVARKMLKAGMDINFIQTMTGLSKDHILKLKDKIKK